MIKEIEFNSLQEYLDIINSIPMEWNLAPSTLWFRGVNDKRFSLEPGCVWKKINIETEESFVLEFLLNYRTYHESCINNPLELYSLMQHYGMPTRLLDWTSSPLVALYFSMENESPTNNTVWVMSPVDLNNITLGMETNIIPKLNPDDCYLTKWLPKCLRAETGTIPPYPLAFKQPRVNKRILSQKGCFTLHGTNVQSIEHYFSNAKNKCLVKLILKTQDAREEILEQLYAIGFKEDDIYQDLNSLSRRIIREQSSLIDD